MKRAIILELLVVMFSAFDAGRVSAQTPLAPPYPQGSTYYKGMVISQQGFGVPGCSSNQVPNAVGSGCVTVVPSSGGTFTGSIFGTDATFSSFIQSQSTKIFNGTSISPTTNLSFGNPTLNLIQYDASPVISNTGCGGTSPQGIGNFAPLLSNCLFASGSNNAGVRYDFGDFLNGFTGTATSDVTVVSLEHGSNPQQMVGPNVVIGDNSALDINTCSVTASVATCSLTSAFTQSQWPNGTVIWVSGSSGNINSGAISFTVSSSTSNSISFDCSAQACSGTSNGGQIRHYHFGAWMLETDAFNNSYDPKPISPVIAQNVTPWHGITSTSVGNYPISTGFFVNGPVYEGYLCKDAYDACFVAGYPLQGSGAYVPHSVVGFESRPTQVATATNNYNSRSMKFTQSVWNAGTTTYNEQSYQIQAVPATGSLPTSSLNTYGIDAISYLGLSLSSSIATITLSPNGVQRATINATGASLILDSLTGNDIRLRSSGVDKFTVSAAGLANASGGFSSNGNAGYTGTVTCSAGQHINSLTISGGIITAAPTCN